MASYRLRFTQEELDTLLAALDFFESEWPWDAPGQEKFATYHHPTAESLQARLEVIPVKN